VTDITAAVPPAPDEDLVHAEQEHAHPDEKMYITVGVVLVVLTALEVSTYAFGMRPPALLFVLVPLMAVKFWLVVAFFMHLRFDSPLFRRVFVAGIVLALGVYTIVLVTLHAYSA
jgi:cytochrome c oxidase subunit 4